MNNRPSKAATRKLIPKYIIESIMTYAFKLPATNTARQLYPFG
jgi:hypothetical protein